MRRRDKERVNTMSIDTILKGLDDTKRRQERRLRSEVLEEYAKHQKSRFDLGRLLVELHDRIVGEKLFKKYLKSLGIVRSSAYRWMEHYRALAKLPEPIVLAAGKRKIDLVSRKYRTAAQVIPLPEEITDENAGEWLDNVEARQEELRNHISASPQPPVLSPQERDALTSRVFLKLCRQLDSFAARHWEKIPPKKCTLEVVISLMGAVAAQLGITQPFTVYPDPNPGKSDRLVNRLKARIPRKLEIEVPVLA